MAKGDTQRYKDTINLPRTDFDMRAGLLKKEPERQARWTEMGLYQRIRESRAGARQFILHDGPPYANGNIHMGTALNKVLKDMVIKIQTMSGKDAPYVPGWDCHGLPIEHKVMQELGEKARTMDAQAIRKRCRDYAQKFSDLHIGQFQQLGVLGAFDEPYLTMNPQYEASVLEVFAQLVEQGLVYRQLKPVHWSIENETALAEAELEYKDREDPSIFVGFEVDSPPECWPRDKADRFALLVWTTTPWTLPANVAVAVHPKICYVSVEVEKDGAVAGYMVAEDLVETVFQAFRSGGYTVLGPVGSVSGESLTTIQYHHPITENETHPVVLADYVTLEQGTGLVHTAPGHGADDFVTGRKYGLDVVCPVREDGTFDTSVPDWIQGKRVWEANPIIVEKLKASGHLVHTEMISHSYPHDWRSKGPIIFRATEQWFIAVDTPAAKTDTSLRDQAIQVTDDSGPVNFVPQWGQARMRGMLESRPDWCISRQRYWGLPIPVFYTPQGHSVLTPMSVRAVGEVFREKGSDSWYGMSVSELLHTYDPGSDPDFDSPDRDVSQWRKGGDIFDVWFESGSSWYAVAVQRGLVAEPPVDLYLEGSDQHRGWFQLSLLTALGATGRSPFKDLVTHGFIVTEEGLKMSKSLGNTIEVIDQLKIRGADILRLWLSFQDFHTDVRCSEALIRQSEDSYRKIRNTLRFLMGACDDFDPLKDAQEPEAHSLDAWFDRELSRLIADVRSDFSAYIFHRAVRRIYEFCTVEASSMYLAAVKDRLYCDAPNSCRRRSAQTVMYRALTALVRLLAPVIPHTADEAWEHIPFRRDAEESVHLSLFPEGNCNQPPGEIMEWGEVVQEPVGSLNVWATLFQLRDEGLKKLEAIRNAGVKKPLDTEAILQVGDDFLGDWLATYVEDLEDLLGVGFARINIEPGLEGVRVDIVDTREIYERCDRSWKRRPDVGSDPSHPGLSERDAASVRMIRGDSA